MLQSYGLFLLSASLKIMLENMCVRAQQKKLIFFLYFLHDYKFF